MVPRHARRWGRRREGRLFGLVPGVCSILLDTFNCILPGYTCNLRCCGRLPAALPALLLWLNGSLRLAEHVHQRRRVT